MTLCIFPIIDSQRPCLQGWGSEKTSLTCALCSCVPAVSVGYEYESCPDLILWEKRTAVLQGYEIDASKLGGWNLDKHHALNIQSGERNHGIPWTRLRWHLLCYPVTLTKEGRKEGERGEKLTVTTWAPRWSVIYKVVHKWQMKT